MLVNQLPLRGLTHSRPIVGLDVRRTRGLHDHLPELVDIPTMILSSGRNLHQHVLQSVDFVLQFLQLLVHFSGIRFNDLRLIRVRRLPKRVGDILLERWALITA